MDETIVHSSNDVQFIEGITRMNQENWQKYFGTALEDKMTGFGVQILGVFENSYTRINSGSVTANAIVAWLDFEGGFIDDAIGQPSESLRDIFYCARVYLADSRVELVKKTNIVDEISDTKYINVLNNLMLDGSYLCDRSITYYEMPIAYLFPGIYIHPGSALSFQVIELHRRYNRQKMYEIDFLGNFLHGSGTIYDDDFYHEYLTHPYLALDFLDQVEDFYVLTNQSGGTLYIENIPLLNSSIILDYYSRDNVSYTGLRKYVFHLKGSHLSMSQNSKEVVYANPSNSNMKGLHIRKMYTTPLSGADYDGSLAHYFIEEI